MKILTLGTAECLSDPFFKAAKEAIPGGLSSAKTLDEIAGIHGVTVASLQKQIDKGTIVEMEHCNSEVTAREIALDHLVEDPAYYDHLAEMESKY